MKRDQAVKKLKALKVRIGPALFALFLPVSCRAAVALLLLFFQQHCRRCRLKHVRRAAGMKRDQAVKKLKALKELAERGVGGEKEGAQRLPAFILCKLNYPRFKRNLYFCKHTF